MNLLQTWYHTGVELILTHSYTDFDALAAQLGAALIYPDALPVLNPQLNANVREFVTLYADLLPFRRLNTLPHEPVTHLILVDTSTVPRLAILGDAPVPTVIVDHHPPGRPLLPHELLICADVGATTTILVQQLMDGNVPLTPEQATLLLLGIYEDTGGLTHAGTRPVDAECAAWLLRQHARLTAVGEFLQRPLTPEQEALFHQAEEQSCLLELNGRLILLATVRVDGAVPELSPLAHRLRSLFLPDVLVLAVSVGGSGTQLIIRSQPDALDAGALAAFFGGGGHQAAAAAFIHNRDAAEVLEELEHRLNELLRPARTAFDIMTARVRTIAPDATIADAEDLLARYGHGALPVIAEDGRVQGLIARRDIDRARRHNLLSAPVARYMWHGPALIAPDAPLSAVQQALTSNDGERTGRLLVVDAQQHLLGLITRSDLLHARIGHQSDERNGHAGLSDQLEQFLRPELAGLLRHAGRVAAQQNAALYIVGGSVRDMLLGRPQDDLDLVVEGDAITLAQTLAVDLGGEVRSHTRFGTATLLLPHSPIPPIDFVMARTELYEHPSALPLVEAASLRHDLHRRDFTINTLAICLNPERYGRLYDFYGGRRDIERRLIRVLHNLSFIDDPTRILRAARLAARLECSVEPRTHALILDSVEQDVLGRTTPQRVVNELRLTLREALPERALELLEAWGVLQQFHPHIHWNDTLAKRFAAARQARFSDAPLADLYLGLVLWPLDAAGRAELLTRYQPAAAQAVLLRDLSRVQERLPELAQPALPNSRIDQLLSGIDPVALRTAQLSTAPPIPERIVHYLTTLCSIRTKLNGHDLHRLGLRPGPRFREILADLRAARLDGRIQTRDDEEAWVRTQASR